MGLRSICSSVLYLTLPLLAVSCGTLREVIQEGTGAVVGGNQMMLVRCEPPSYGFLRMQASSRSHPDVSRFVKQKGVPDFFAEAKNTSGRYQLFYYLRSRQAFICRTSLVASTESQFAGPYPITAKEHRLLSDFQRQQNSLMPQ